MSRDTYIFSELLNSETRKLSLNSRIFEIIIRYIDQDKQVRVRSLFKRINDSHDFEEKQNLINALRKKLCEPVKYPIVDSTALIDIKNVLKYESLNIDNDTIIKLATVIHEDPERAALSVLEQISGSIKRIKSCNEGLEVKQEKVIVPATFKGDADFNAKKFLEECIKKGGVSDLALQKVFKKYPDLEYSRVFTIDIFKKLIDFKILENKSMDKKMLNQNKFTLEDLDKMSKLAKELVTFELLNTTVLDFPQLEDLFNEYHFMNVYEIYKKVYGCVNESFKNDEHYKTKLKPELLLSEINNEIIHTLGSRNSSVDDVFEYATRYLTVEEEEALMKSIDANREMINKFSVRTFNDSLESDLSEEERKGLILDSMRMDSEYIKTK